MSQNKADTNASIQQPSSAKPGGTELSVAERALIDHEISLVPYRKAAVIEALKIVQQNRRWVSDESLDAIARYLDMNAAEVDSVATFYNLIFRRPVGRHVMLLCDSVSCYIMGCTELYRSLQQRLGIEFGHTTSDNRFTLLPNCCLGCCDHAPALMIDDDLYRDVKPMELEGILKHYE
ncbi:NADH-quinone oxidoreductase subunit NuoE [Flavihumibacter petaseus]|uniref:NADH--quinone oxidoreductase subunit E n=1 Tax=Flavihumibacter petaseus NBRC 106054 TaxID=1220578 RepID=A0A0E9MUN0_9BACT|nr:NADH-quinone oxidoreductase subunit NuoE [Flavihumibacter petaseus]GAO41126.1 NADH--quinone oxidoreductase subunit E [Flavihumibacter petaseus NBRC 106054]